MGKLSFVVGLGAGYVLGARAGRRRYEQIRSRAVRLWSSEPVQARVADATELVKDHAAPLVADRLAGLVGSMNQSVRERVNGEDRPSQGGP